jgi:ketosteroid isomerase-like protein
MPRSNAELALEAFRAYQERGMAGALEYCADDLVFDEPPEQPGHGEFRGREEVLDAWFAWCEPWLDQSSDLEQVVDHGDRVLLLSHEHLVGGDRHHIDHHIGIVLSFRDGKIARWQSFWTPARALHEFGLHETPVA